MSSFRSRAAPDACHRPLALNGAGECGECGSTAELSDEVLLHILHFLCDEDEMRAVALVCRRWARLERHHEELWARRCQRSGVGWPRSSQGECASWRAVYIASATTPRFDKAGRGSTLTYKSLEAAPAAGLGPGDDPQMFWDSVHWQTGLGARANWAGSAPIIRVVLSGDPGMGKWSFLLRFSDGEFSEHRCCRPIGVDFRIGRCLPVGAAVHTTCRWQTCSMKFTAVCSSSEYKTRRVHIV